MTAWRTRLGATLLAAGLLGGAAACTASGGDESSALSEDDAGMPASGDLSSERADALKRMEESVATAGGASTGGAEASGGSGTDFAARVLAQGRSVISTARVTLESEDLSAARDDLDRLLGKHGGFVADEKSVRDDTGSVTSSVLTLRVPSTEFDDALRELDDLGTVRSESRETDDVTTRVIDLGARIRTTEVSLERLRGFLSKSNNVTETIRLEQEIATREAQLASLRAQKRYLDDQTSMSTIALTMRLAGTETPPEDDPLDDAGFLTGLRHGWAALVGILLVGATVLGAAVPFAVVLGLLGVPAYVWLRRHRTVSPPAS